MLIFILRRLMQSLFVLLAVSLVVFFAVYAVGDPDRQVLDWRFAARMF